MSFYFSNTNSIVPLFRRLATHRGLAKNVLLRNICSVKTSSAILSKGTIQGYTQHGYTHRLLYGQLQSKAILPSRNISGAFKSTVNSRGISTKVTYPKYTFNWWKEWIIVFTVFSITGSSSVYLTRPLVKTVYGLEGSFKEGPWTYRLAYLLTTVPSYSFMLVVYGTLAGRGPYFRAIAIRMWSRLIPALKRFI